jgi:hypothetical protein
MKRKAEIEEMENLPLEDDSGKLREDINDR